MGFTYINRIAAKEVHASLKAKYPGVNLVQYILTNQLVVPNMTAQIVQLVEVQRCDMIFMCSRTLVEAMLPNGLSPLSFLYPNVHFWVLSLPLALSLTNPRNVFGGVGDITPAWFIAGAAAAVECSSCIGMMVPLSNHHGSIDAFYLGMKFGERFRDDGANVTTLCPVVGVNVGGFSNPPAEIAFAQLLEKRGCSIMSIFSDDYGGAKYIQQQQQQREIFSPLKFSITGNVNGALVVGDTVLTAVYFDYGSIFRNMTESLILGHELVNGMIAHSTLGDTSPLAKLNTTRAIAAAQGLLKTNVSAIWCQPLFDQQGVLINPNGSCLTFAQYSTLNVLMQPLVPYGTFPSPLVCAPGTYCSYNYATNLALTCEPCPINTYSAASGSMNCTSCPAGTTSAGNASACLPVVAPSSSGMPLSALLPLCIILSVAAVAALVAVVWKLRSVRDQGVAPPTDSPLALVILDVDGERSSEGWRTQMLRGAYIFEFLRASVERVTRKHDAYIALASPTTFLIAAKTVAQAYGVAEDVEALLATNSHQGNFISIRAVVHYGQVLCIPSMSEDSRRARYVGPAVDTLLEVNREAQSRLGQMIVTERALEAIAAADETVRTRITNSFSCRLGKTDTVRCVRVMFKSAQVVKHESLNRTRSEKSGMGLSSSSRSLPISPSQQIQAMCWRTLQLFLGVCRQEMRSRVARTLLERFRILLPADVTQAAVIDHICQSIAPDLVGTMDELHVQEQLRMIRSCSRIDRAQRPFRRAVSTGSAQNTSV